MNKLLAIIGNAGVGKTTLAIALRQAGGFNLALEELEVRPFQKAFAENLELYAFPNQVDFLTYRGEQEIALRYGPGTGILDGGLDLDFEVFTRYFYARGYLLEAEFQLCERIYRLLRRLLPPPELYLYLEAPLKVIEGRLVRRGRALEIAGVEAIVALDKFLKDWVERLKGVPVLRIDAGAESFGSATHIQRLAGEIRAQLFPGG